MTNSAGVTTAHLHADTSRVLRAWEPPDLHQQQLRDQYLDHLVRYPHGVERACVIGHITASALVMDQACSRVLLTLHPKVGRWLQLGGHLEPDDASLQDAAARESREESGIENLTISTWPLRLDRHRVPCAGAMSEHLDVQYLVQVPQDAVAVMSEESDDLRWFDLGSLPEGLDASVLALIEAATLTS